MPEGDTIFRAAAVLRGSILGAVIREAAAGGHLASSSHLAPREEAISPSSLLAPREEAISRSEMTTRPLPMLAPEEVASLAGGAVAGVETRGKHLLIHLDRGIIVHSHMGMTGSWHVYAPGQAWRKPAHRAELALSFDRATAVCFSPKLLELLTAGQLKNHRWLTRLGPDLLAAALDEGEVLRRLRRHDRIAIGEAVMNQTIVAGIGNIYKSELLFLEALYPLAKVGELSNESLLSLIRRARKLLKRNVLAGPRRTRFRGDRFHHWVYGRQGKPCLKCGRTIRLTRQGELGRTTFFCPQCQGSPCGR